MWHSKLNNRSLITWDDEAPCNLVCNLVVGHVFSKLKSSFSPSDVNVEIPISIPYSFDGPNPREVRFHANEFRPSSSKLQSTLNFVCCLFYWAGFAIPSLTTVHPRPKQQLSPL